ncbi:MAG: 3-deoxy-D-manno-octulosonic acid transferase [Burkholderiales bacterium]|nr:3-deoxy-D-manno-octulosonic acid transferase [Burkholderiales bacterium]
MSITRAVYSGALYLAAPFAMAHLIRRSFKQPEYKDHWSERFGFGKYPEPKPGRDVIWIHGVSVGETRAAEPLVEMILKNWPKADILFTHTTPTGREDGKKIAQRFAGRISQSYLPYDTPAAVKRFLRKTRPEACILMETEVWPNLTYYCKKKGIPVLLANARLSEKSLNKGKKAGAVIKEAMGRVTVALAQAKFDAQRLKEAGCPVVEVAGNMKFDFKLNAAQVLTGKELRKLSPRFVVALASTRQGEEEKMLKYIRDWENDPTTPKPLWLIIPRHPQRFREVRRLIEKAGLSVQNRTSIRNWKEILSNNGPQVVLGDSMGEMTFYYALSDVVLMGGSFGNYGCQSLIEPCATGTPVIVGPSVFNFEATVNEADQEGAIIRAPNEEEAFNDLRRLLKDDKARIELGEKALAFTERKKGATEKAFNYLSTLLEEKENGKKVS